MGQTPPTCESCRSYVGEPPTAIFFSESYECIGRQLIIGRSGFIPSIFIVEVPGEPQYTYDITMKSRSNASEIKFRVTLFYQTNNALLQSTSQGVIINCRADFRAENSHIIVTLNNPPGFIKGQDYNLGDTYTIYPESGCRRFARHAKAIFTEQTNRSVSSNLQLQAIQSVVLNNFPISVSSQLTTMNTSINYSCENTCDTICEAIRIPQINITAQTTIDGSDIGDALFTIIDDGNLENICAIQYTKSYDKIVYHRCCPYIVSVVKGKGKTLFERLNNIYDKLGETKIGVSFMIFYQNIVLYGMSKYILSKLLYGDFDINYLLGKYNEKFLSDLGSSRFCGFIEFFEDCESPVRGYNKYFKY